ncbi:MAG: T9SS type A sorting domain-containing protein, partial [Flavobacteriales bacterium]
YAVGNATDGNGNENNDYVYTTNLTLSPAVGVLEADQADLALQVFPNPTQDLIQLNYTLPNSGTVEVQLFDVRGSLIRSMGKSNQGVGAVNQTFSIADLAAGAYCIQLRLDGQLMASRLVNKQ